MAVYMVSTMDILVETNHIFVRGGEVENLHFTFFCGKIARDLGRAPLITPRLFEKWGQGDALK